ncbi:MAG: DUF4339 domain-containing protein [Thermoguttaceae bacterium]
MSQHWYYTQGGQRQGPVTSEKLKELAASGQLVPTDLAWKEGMAQWVEAQKVKGLFPEKPIAPPPAPPPLPVGVPSGPPPIPPHPTAAPSANPIASSEAPALWNPQAAGIWTALFGLVICSYLGWAFGAFLLARNWKAIGDAARAKRSMIWFYAVFASAPLWTIIYYFTSQGEWTLGKHVIRHGSILVVFFAWAFSEVSPQAKFVKAHFGNQYPRKKWWHPLGIAAALVIVIYGASFVVGILGSRPGLEKTLTFTNGEICFMPPVTESEASRLGGFLLANKFFDGDRKTVQIKKSEGVYQFRIPVKTGSEQDEAFVDTCTASCRSISRNVFKGAPVEVHLCDKHLNTVRVVRP